MKRKRIKYWRRSSRWRKALANAKNNHHRFLLLTLAEGLNPWQWSRVTEFFEGETFRVAGKLIAESLLKPIPFVTLLEHQSEIVGDTLTTTITERVPVVKPAP